MNFSGIVLQLACMVLSWASSVGFLFPLFNSVAFSQFFLSRPTLRPSQLLLTTQCACGGSPFVDSRYTSSLVGWYGLLLPLPRLLPLSGFITLDASQVMWISGALSGWILIAPRDGRDIGHCRCFLLWSWSPPFSLHEQAPWVLWHCFDTHVSRLFSCVVLFCTLLRGLHRYRP